MSKMVIEEIKAKRIFAGPGMYAYVAEAEVFDDDTGDTVYVAVQEYSGSEYTVSGKSVYAFLAGDGEAPADGFIEEYTKADDAKKSGYWKVFDILRKNIKVLG